MSTFERFADENEIRHLVRIGQSHRQISTLYQQRYPGIHGLSARSVRRYCDVQDIHRVSDDELTDLVERCIARYGHTYGRRLMQGSIRSMLGATEGAVSQRRISAVMRNIAPRALNARTRDLLIRTNPLPYYAPYFGYKAHLDQNEKNAQQFGLTHVCLIDGCSRFIAGYISIPVKNPILIYEFLFLPAVRKYGLWEQIRTDHGREFYLLHFVQHVLGPFRRETSRVPSRMTKSTDNYVAERVWPEINSRINYPLKRALIYVVENFDYDLEDPVVSYSLSWISLYVSADAIEHFINSWNYHRVPGPSGCIPIENMRETSRNVFLPPGALPSTVEAVRMYEARGGTLTRDAQFGIDPLSFNAELYNERTFTGQFLKFLKWY